MKRVNKEEVQQITKQNFKKLQAQKIIIFLAKFQVDQVNNQIKYQIIRILICTIQIHKNFKINKRMLLDKMRKIKLMKLIKLKEEIQDL